MAKIAKYPDSHPDYSEVQKNRSSKTSARAKKRKVAIFDIDGTVFRSSLLIELVETLVREGVFPPRALKRYERDKRRWLNRQGSYESYIMSVVFAFRKNLKGVAYKKFLHAARRVVALHQNRVYRYTRDLVRQLKKSGYYLVAISHSPLGIVGPFARNMGFHKVYGILYELGRDGKFNGKVLYQDLISDKAKILSRVVEKERLTLRGSVGVGDTESDIPFLRRVARPVCFNPNEKLYRAARRFGWSIVVERKDVIYKI